MISIQTSNDIFIQKIISNIKKPSPEIISALNIYFTKSNYEYMFVNINDDGKCSCCDELIPSNVIPDRIRFSIMDRIEEKILSTKYNHSSSEVITLAEQQIIREKWMEYSRLLKTNNFDIIIDGANLGYNSRATCSKNQTNYLANTYYVQLKNICYS